ncbi:hypothetical protein ACFX5U_04310 [Sphingobacterium sp. SG20118]|uniref:hypothetical protein n=1 Tax=Sphingobacterium TaxID=28453 RepID=UPI0004F7B028|nr:MULTISPECIES: hypothetical protein [Sphingobacterium]AIM36259.1 hypothetical protein KO02_05770 [Sphingobacterium sp. ML3W]MDH5827615.1 hypothetical protein [Sphingobacterium faecium]
MEASVEYEIWDSIVNSAKTRFDYNHILSLFKNTDSEIIDKFLFHVLVAFACGEEHATISTNLFNELQQIGFDCSEQQIDQFIADKHERFNIEIYATYIAFSLLEDGEDPETITATIHNLLKKPE